jgi:GTP-binding protein
VGEERSVVHDMPGTTRDAIDTAIETPDGRIVVVDTAGMRRKAKVDDPTEYFSLVRALRAVDEADVALLVIDSTEGVTGQDQRLAERIVASGSPVVIVLNKWEMLVADDREEIERTARRELSFLGDAPIVRISALTGRGVGKVLPLVAEAIARYRTRVSTTEVNRIIADAQQRHPAGADVRILYALQGSANPPTFTLFATRELAQHYVRYLERCLRERLDLGSTPIVMRVRTRRK